MLWAILLFVLVLTGMATIGLIINLLLFPEMWQQDDVPRFIRWFTEGR